ncbi:hypothetical protein G9C98_002645 [Cotesia typhae]|uniref:Uncharacterized protein n=1 Tax=Cotesia typhae TaxID=2053667 RepID=A0A8J5R8I2_9HYME|nr:hypothetical protein G9C98_002645 [Cotesia typhae]
MSLFVFINLLILIGTRVRMILISEACLNDGSYCSWGSECCSKKCEFLRESYFPTCILEPKEEYTSDIIGTTTSFNVEEPSFCLLYGQCEKDKDCCSKECVKSQDGTEFNQCKEIHRRRKHQYS